MKFDIIGDKKDERLIYLLQQVKTAVSTFVEAIRSSSEEQVGISYKAFTLKTKSPMEAQTVFDVIVTSFIIEMKEQAEDLTKKYTFYHQVEDKDTEEPKLFFHCRKETPPTKEEVDKLIAEKKEVMDHAHTSPVANHDDIVVCGQ